MKRIICLLLVILMVGVLFVSCGDPSGDEPSTDPGTTDVPSTGDGDGDGNDGNGDGGNDDDPTPAAKWYDEVKFPQGTSITLQLSNVEDKELSCGCARYMQGPETVLDGDGGFEKVQNEVLKRNDAAKAALGLEVNYTYINKDWGQGISGAIIESEKLGPGMTPDMYCDQMYDMAGLSYQHGIFSNILKYTQSKKAGVDGWKEGAGYFHISSTNGYNVQLMNDMALTSNKQFLIASDYYVDVMRAMFVMPFNLEMYAGYAAPDDENAENLYKTVKDGKWTWDQMLTFAGVYNGSGKASMDSERVLMALSVGGLPAMGIVYSSKFENFTYNNGVYTLSENCTEVVNAFKSAAEVARHNSVLCGEATRGDAPAVEKCKEVFTSGRALFAGPQMLGVVEEENFLKMSKLSIVPVPKTKRTAEYNTAINTRARVGALSFNSPLKKETSAWIQYSTEKSDVVKKEYFEKAMNSKYLSGTGAEEMLDFIYKKVGSSKSMILDHLILYKDWDMQKHTWTSLIQKEDYQAHENDINTIYLTAVQAKQSVLNDIMVEWSKADEITAE